MKTYNQLCIDARNAVRGVGSENPNWEARNLVAFAAGKKLEELVRDYMLYANDDIEARVNELVRRRVGGEPLAYILGTWEFYGLEFNVSPAVLIPRIDTEVLAEEALDLILRQNPTSRVLDLCSGSGCIGCTIGVNAPQTQIVMVDMSDDALRVARANAMKHSLGARAACIKANALKAPPETIGTFDIIVSNPPYIKTDEVVTLDPSVRDFEPTMALDGGSDGYMFYRAIVRKWRSVLREGGWMLFEVGEEQAHYVALQLKKAGFCNIRIVKDTAGTERVVLGQLFKPEKE